MTNLDGPIERVFKTDAVGRVKTPPERREQLLDEFERSGLSGAKFAQLAGIKYQTFTAWAARRRQQRGRTSTPIKTVDPVRWLEAVVSEAQSPAGTGRVPVKLHLPAGAWIELNDPQQVTLAAALLHALQKALPRC